MRCIDCKQSNVFILNIELRLTENVGSEVGIVDEVSIYPFRNRFKSEKYLPASWVSKYSALERDEIIEIC